MYVHFSEINTSLENTTACPNAHLWYEALAFSCANWFSILVFMSEDLQKYAHRKHAAQVFSTFCNIYKEFARHGICNDNDLCTLSLLDITTIIVWTYSQADMHTPEDIMTWAIFILGFHPSLCDIYIRQHAMLGGMCDINNEPIHGPFIYHMTFKALSYIFIPNN